MPSTASHPALEVEALQVSERHIVTSHADAHLEKRGQGGEEAL